MTCRPILGKISFSFWPIAGRKSKKAGPPETASLSEAVRTQDRTGSQGPNAVDFVLPDVEPAGSPGGAGTKEVFACRGRLRHSRLILAGLHRATNESISASGRAGLGI